MRSLFVSELRRFRRGALVFAAAHLALLVAVSAFDLFTPSPAKLGLGAVLYAVAGLAFGLYQLGTQRRLNMWTFLVHRPLSPGRIFVALAGAGATLLAAVVGLPLLVLVLYTDLLTTAGLDGRQYWLVPFVLGHVLAFYLGGVLVALAPRRAFALVLVLPTLYLTRQAPGGWIFVPLALVVAWLAFLAYRAFKPSLEAPLAGGLTLAAAALPIQYALYFLLVAGSAIAWQTSVVVGEVGWRSYAVHAWNDHFPPGTTDHLDYLDARAALQHGLAAGTVPAAAAGAAHLRRQVELAEVAESVPRVRRWPRRDQPGFLDADLTLVDGEQGVLWTFRHDRMLFRGTDAASGRLVGWLGVAGPAVADPAEAAPLPSVPALFGGRWVVTGPRIWQLDGGLRRLVPRFAVAGDERLTTALDDHGPFLTVLSDRALYLVRARDLEASPVEVAPFARVALPVPMADLQRVQIAELLDGYLVSFVGGRRAERGLGDARQVVGELGADGRFRVVAERRLAPGWPPAYLQRGFILSPLIATLHDVAWAAIRGDGAAEMRAAEMRAALVRPLAPSVRWLALLVAVVSALLTARVLRRRGIDGRRRWGWVAMAAAGGVPALLSCLLLTPPAAPAPRSAWRVRLRGLAAGWRRRGSEGVA